MAKVRRYARPMSLLAFLLFGLVVGFIARAIMPGTQSMGCLGTSLLGCAGSFVGGTLGNLVSGRGLLAPLNTGGLIASVIGAMIVLFLFKNRIRR